MKNGFDRKDRAGFTFGNGRTRAQGFARVFCTALLLAAGGVHAQAYPMKPVRIVVPFAAGGSGDVLARLVGVKLGVLWGQQVLVDNRAGGGTTIGAEHVARSTPDGYTLLLVSSSFTVNFSLLQKVPYKFSDFVPLTNMAETPNVLAVHPSLPAKNVKELIGLLRGHPGQLTYSSGGIGASTHLAGELFQLLAKVNMVHVPYKGGNPAVTALVSGQVSMTFGNLTNVIAFVNAGRLRALAVTSARRTPVLPDLPTAAEAGVEGMESSSWIGLMAPAATPEGIVAKLNADIVKVLNLPDTREKLAVNGLELIGDTSAQFGAYMSAEISRWARVIKAAGLKPE